MMSARGTFNGPGGTHNRWQIPNAGGSALGPHHMLHFKNRLGVLPADEQVTLERNTLADQGVAVATVQARSSVPDDGELVGVTVNFGTGGDLAGTTPTRAMSATSSSTARTGAGATRPTGSRSSSESATTRSCRDTARVLLSKSRTSGTPNAWIIDPRPQDIGMIDFYRPDGPRVPVVRGDPRQLNDATFHAGTNSGSQYEYVDTFNSLHFYVLDKRRDAEGVLSPGSFGFVGR